MFLLFLECSSSYMLPKVSCPISHWTGSNFFEYIMCRCISQQSFWIRIACAISDLHLLGYHSNHCIREHLSIKHYSTVPKCRVYITSLLIDDPLKFWEAQNQVYIRLIRAVFMCLTRVARRFLPVGCSLAGCVRLNQGRIRSL
jgi:hypothetical protein